MYQYRHQNGQIIDRVDYVVNSMGAREYFDSPFVIAWWHIDDKTNLCDKNIGEWMEYSFSDE